MSASEAPLVVRGASLRVGPRRSIRGWLGLVALAPLLLFVAIELREPLVAGLFAIVASLAARAARLRGDGRFAVGRAVDDRLEITPSELRFGARTIAPIDAIAFAHVVPSARPDRSTVRVLLAPPSDDTLDLDVRTLAEARAIVDRLHCGPGQARLTLRLPSRLALSPWLAVAVALVPVALALVMSALAGKPGHEGVEAIAFVLTALGTVAAAILLGTGTLVEVGADRLRARWLLRDETALLADLASVEQTATRVRVRTRDGATLDLPAKHLGRTDADAAARAIVERLDHARHPARSAGVRALSSAPRDAREAIAHARARGADSGGFRDEATTVDDLLATLESPAAAHRLRVLAAVALDERLRADPSRDARTELSRDAQAMLESTFATLLDRVGVGDRDDFDALALAILRADEAGSPDAHATADATEDATSPLDRASR